MDPAYLVEAKFDGVDPGSRRAYGYRLVDLDRAFDIGDGGAHGDPNIEGQKPTPSLFDHITKMARVLTKRYRYRNQKLDLAEMVAMLLVRVDELEAKIDQLK